MKRRFWLPLTLEVWPAKKEMFQFSNSLGNNLYKSMENAHGPKNMKAA